MIGSKIGPYQIRAEIGRWGMATVYRTYQPAVDRDVAIKIIRQDNSDSGLAQRVLCKNDIAEVNFRLRRLTSVIVQDAA